MAADPIFIAARRTPFVQAVTANTNRDGTGTIATVVTAGTNGTRIERVRVKAVGTTTVGMIRLYISDGTNIRLLHEIPVTAITPSGTVESFEAEIVFSDNELVLQTGHLLRASTHVTETFNIFCEVGDF